MEPTRSTRSDPPEDELSDRRRELLREYLRSCLEELSTPAGFHTTVELRRRLQALDAEIAQRSQAAFGKDESRSC